jgi:hypothetical protein
LRINIIRPELHIRILHLGPPFFHNSVKMTKKYKIAKLTMCKTQS